MQTYSVTVWDFGGTNTGSCQFLTCTPVHGKISSRNSLFNRLRQINNNNNNCCFTCMVRKTDKPVFYFGTQPHLWAYIPSHLIPSARHELPYSSFLSVPPGPRLILSIFPVPIFLCLSISLLCCVSLPLSSVFSRSST